MLSSRDTDYIQIGTHYFIAARHATFCYLMPVAGNLYHHAFEMILKAKLLSKYSPENLKNKFKHNLRLIWEEFKSVVQAKKLEEFDNLIDEINKWEEIRYPNYPRGRSLSMFTDMRKDYKSDSPSINDEDKYRINLEAMDELFKVVILSWPINPDFIKAYLAMGDSLKTYERDNQYLIWEKASLGS